MPTFDMGRNMGQAAGKLSEWLMLQLITKQKTRLREICCSLLPRHMVNMGECPSPPFASLCFVSPMAPCISASGPLSCRAMTRVLLHVATHPPPQLAPPLLSARPEAPA